MRQPSSRDPLKWMSAVIGNKTAFDNEKKPYRKVCHERHRHEKCETIQPRKLTD